MVKSKWDEMIAYENAKAKIAPTELDKAAKRVEKIIATFEKMWKQLPWIVRFIDNKQMARSWFLQGTLFGMEELTNIAKEEAENGKDKKRV